MLNGFEKGKFWQSIESLHVINTHRMLPNWTVREMATLADVKYFLVDVSSPVWGCDTLVFSLLGCINMLYGFLKTPILAVHQILTSAYQA